MATDCDGDSLYCYILSWGRHIDAFARTVAARISHDNEGPRYLILLWRICTSGDCMWCSLVKLECLLLMDARLV